MTIKKLIPLLLISLLLCPGCSSITQKMDVWQGQHKIYLTDHWGTPTGIQSDGIGGEIYVYKSVTKRTFPGAERLSAKPCDVFKFHRYRAFWVNTEGYVYSWKYKTW